MLLVIFYKLVKARDVLTHFASPDLRKAETLVSSQFKHFMNIMLGMGHEYSSLEEVEIPLSNEQLRILKNQVESEKPDVLPQSLFNYGWGLIKSTSRQNQKEGVEVLSALYRDVPSMRRESLYYLALGSYKVGDYSNARRYAGTLVKTEPQNPQAMALKEAIDEKVTQEGLIGIGIAGGALAIGIGILGVLMRRKR